MAEQLDLSRPPVRAKGFVHKQIAATAKGLAREQYAELARDNRFYKRWPNVEVFVEKNWQHYIQMVRQMFTAMLGSPKYDEKFKAQIAEALLLDGTINPKKMAEPAKPIFFPTTKLSKI